MKPFNSIISVRQSRSGGSRISGNGVHARLFVDALWSPAGKGLTSWLSFAMSNCDVVTFPSGVVLDCIDS